MIDALNSATTTSLKRRLAAPALLGWALGAFMLAGFLPASAQTVTVWSGYPEMAPFYEHVAQEPQSEASRISTSRSRRSPFASMRNALRSASPPALPVQR